jgi:hypothetical protein
MDDDQKFAVIEAVEYLKSKGARLTEVTLATLRSKGSWPPFRKVFKRIYYLKSGLDAYVDEHTSKVVRSIAELRQK